MTLSNASTGNPVGAPGARTADSGARATPAPDQAAFQDFSSTGTTGTGEVPLALLLDLSLSVTVELGRTTLTVAELLRLGTGAVIQLDRLAGEPVELRVGDRRFAEGEVVLLGDHFGIRITKICAPAAPGMPVA